MPIDEDKIRELQDSKEQLLSEISSLKTQLNTTQQNIDKLQYSLDNKLDDEICPTCFQKVDHDHIVSYLNEQLDTEKCSYDKISKELMEKNHILETSKQSLDEMTKSKENNTKIDNQLNQLSSKIERIKNDIKEAEQQKQLIEKSKKYQRVIDKLEKCWDNLKSQIDGCDTSNIDKSIEECEEFIQQYNDTVKELQNIEDVIQKENAERDRIRQWINNNQTKINELSEEIKNGTKECKRLKSIKDYLKVVKDLCKDEEAKQYTLSSKVPLLNQRVNYYLSKSGVNFYVKLDNWLETTIKGPGIRDFTYENLSGAERVSLSRSLQFALSDLNKLQSPTSVDLLILDELLDSSVDTSGLYNICNIVKTKQEEDNSNVLIVSHRESFENMENFIDNVCCVEYDGKYSKVKYL